MLIQQKQLDHWVNHFYGYGSWESKFWFVAFEEGGGNLPEEVGDKFNYFYQHHPAAEPTLCDVRELYRRTGFSVEGNRAELFSTLHDYRFGEHAVLHGVWKNLIAFENGYSGDSVPDLLAFQRSSFASVADQREALIALYPLPSPHNHAWYYSWLDLPESRFLKTRTLYQEHVYQMRINDIFRQLITHKPDVVIMYGMENINVIKQSVQQFFTGATFTMVKALKQQIPQHHRARIGNTTLIITTQIPALRHNRIESGFDWYATGALTRSHSH